MIDNCYIDGMSTMQHFSTWVTKGGYSDLLAFPALADPDRNDWPEEDGIEVDLDNPVLQEKEISISFLSGSHVSATDFIAYLTQPGYHTLRIPSLQRQWKLRLSGQSENKLYPTATSFTLKFIEDIPGRPAIISLPDPGLPMRPDRYKLDGISFAAYGIVIDVARDELLKSPAGKQNLNRKVSTLDGQIYDADHLVFCHKEVTFKCHLSAASITAFWQCYEAFFHALIQPGERRFYWQRTDSEYPCYYKSCSGFKVLKLSGPVVMTFELTLVFTSFRIEETEYLLATEAGELIVTEDGNYLIDMK